ncbi:MAG: hypothetical protein LBV74_16125 [Tannerella sp.]|jgi:hypothetical protein|nr:hypothetical protein [Tannerella sp.]
MKTIKIVIPVILLLIVNAVTFQMAWDKNIVEVIRSGKMEQGHIAKHTSASALYVKYEEHGRVLQVTNLAGGNITGSYPDGELVNIFTYADHCVIIDDLHWLFFGLYLVINLLLWFGLKIIIDEITDKK